MVSNWAMKRLLAGLGIGLLAAVGCTPFETDAAPDDETETQAERGADADADVDADGNERSAPLSTPGPSAGVDVEIGRIIDGDSLELFIDGAEVEVRIEGINAPELYTLGDVESCAGDRARSHFDQLTAQADRLGFQAGEEDRFGRTLGVVDADGVALTYSMVEAGWALALWSAEDDALIEAMRDAASAERGIWGDECGAPASDDLEITEAEVNAPGDDRENLNGEWVTVTNTGSETVDLTGWTIRDETTSNRFLIDDQVLPAGASVRFISGSGSNGGGDYYLGEEFPVWSNRGETILLADPAGLIAAYRFVSG